MRAHIVENGIVTNTIEVESLDVIPNLIEATSGNIGDSYDGVNFTAPPQVTPTPPKKVSMRQARLALLTHGYLQTINSAIQGMAGVQGDAAQIEWEYATEVDRSSSLTSAMTAILGLTEAEVDQLFLEASAL